jgi:methionyl-tRNA formyltransferase
MRLVWIGFHVEGVPALRAVLEAGHRIDALITLTPEAAARRSGAADYAPLCAEFGVPVHRVRDINQPESVALLSALAPDVALVIGWTQILSPAVLRTARIGMIGGHASMLPRDRGRAPVNWAIIRGDRCTGASLIWLAEGVDTGDLVDQRPIEISAYDTCGTVYDKVALANRDMILGALSRLTAGERPGTTQRALDVPPLPARRPEDGAVDWSMDGRQVYDFVRAQARPYPGAFSYLDGQRLHIWEAAYLPELTPHHAAAGTIVGPCVSPREDACGQVVACGTGSLLLLEVEDATGHVVRGRELSDLAWAGKVLNHA